MIIQSIIYQAAVESDLATLAPYGSSVAMFYTKAAPDATFPYVVFHDIVTTPRYAFDRNDHTLKIVQFSIFDKADSSETVQDIRDRVIYIYNRANLDIGSEGKLGMLCTSERGPQLIDEVWQIDLDFNVWY